MQTWLESYIKIRFKYNLKYNLNWIEGDFPVRKFYEFQMMQLGRTVNYS